MRKNNMREFCPSDIKFIIKLIIKYYYNVVLAQRWLGSPT